MYCKGYGRIFTIFSTNKLLGKSYCTVNNFSARDDVIKTILKYQPTEGWNIVKKNLTDSFRNITATNVDAIILDNCIQNEKYSVAESYYKHLQDDKIEINLATTGKLFKLYYNMHLDADKLSSKDDAKIYSLYKKLNEMYPVLDGLTTENVILALSLTKHWKLCLKLFEELKKHNNPSSYSYSCLIIAAFKNKERELAWNLLDNMMGTSRVPTNQCYLTYIKKCTTLKDLEVLLNFLGSNDIICDLEVAESIMNFSRTLGYHANMVSIQNSGHCTNCKNSLPNLNLSDDEFDILKSVFLDKVIIGKDVFRKTTPEELKHFRRLMQNKYDVVVDGLNVAYAAGVKKPLPVLASMVAAVVQHFAEQNKKILLCGRSHLSRFPPKYWNYIKTNADVLLLQSLSQDDPYLLYCALNSGNKTVIVTRDLMRSHVYLLKDPLHKRLFTRWFSQNQYQFIRVTTRGAAFKTPPSFVRTTQKYVNTWHVPYKIPGVEETNSWLCINNL